MKFFIDAYWPKEPSASGRDPNALWYHSGKENLAKRIQKGDKVLLYEMKIHPDHLEWHGSGKLFASVTVSDKMTKVKNVSKVGHAIWNRKISYTKDIYVERDKGIPWDSVRTVLRWKKGATLRKPPVTITKLQYRQLENELQRLAGI